MIPEEKTEEAGAPDQPAPADAPGQMEDPESIEQPESVEDGAVTETADAADVPEESAEMPEETTDAAEEPAEQSDPANQPADATDQSEEPVSADERFQILRLLEAVLFATAVPLAERDLAARIPEGIKVGELLDELAAIYANRGVNLVEIDGKWAFRTAADLGPRLQTEKQVVRKLSRAAVETLAIIAYHQPVTRGEIEEIRGVALSKGTLDTLLEAGWIRPKGRRQTPGRPVTWVTTDAFLDHFGLESRDALPGVQELKAAGLLDARPALSTLGAQAMAETAPRSPDEEEEEQEAFSEEDEAAFERLADED